MSFTALEDASDRVPEGAIARCPDCGKRVASDANGRPLDPHCHYCSALLWCCKRVERNLVLLHPIPQISVEASDIARIGHAIHRTGRSQAVIVNLGGMETVDSSFIAGLVVLRRQVEAEGSQLILCELRPHVAEIIKRLNLDRIFEIKARERDALNAA